MSEIRHDPLTGRRVIVAPDRADRPRQLGAGSALAAAAPCPFCAGNEAMTPPELWALRDDQTTADRAGWKIRVVPNKYPALTANDGWHGDKSFYGAQPGLGTHEVIVEAADHITNFAALSTAQLADVLRAYRERMRVLRASPNYRYLLLYKNQGDRAGATLEHIHSQMIALPMVPEEAAAELSGAAAHHQRTGRCFFCEFIQRERRERLVVDHENFIALCPFAPRFAYETWILPKAHAAIFEESSDLDLLNLGHVLHETLARLNSALGELPFNYFIHSLPTDLTASPHFHWHLEILPQLSRAAGFELGSGAFINSVAPEDAAKLLHDALL